MASSEKYFPTVWSALSHPKRRQIVNLLKENPHTTGEICSYFGVSRAAMEHLKVLEQVGIVQARRDNCKRWNTLSDGCLPHHYKKQWKRISAAFQSLQILLNQGLKAFAEEGIHYQYKYI